jgi:hypothetical protein
MNAAWHAEKARETKELHDAAREVEAAQRQVTEARAQAQRLPVPRVDLLGRAPALGPAVATAADALRAFSAGLSTEDAEQLAAHLEKAGPPLVAAIEALRRAATGELEKKEDAWRPIARQLAPWLQPARDALQGVAAVPQIKKAEEWLKQTSAAMRKERFEPIEQRAIQIWEQLRLQSNVTLDAITLESSGKGRRVNLHVQVDGVDGAALGVMSQGELHCLALASSTRAPLCPRAPSGSS